MVGWLLEGDEGVHRLHQRRRVKQHESVQAVLGGERSEGDVVHERAPQIRQLAGGQQTTFVVDVRRYEEIWNKATIQGVCHK